MPQKPPLFSAQGARTPFEWLRGSPRPPSPSVVPARSTSAKEDSGVAATMEHQEKPGDEITRAEVVRRRRTWAGPILAHFSDWLEVQRRQTTPKSLFGHAVE